MPLTDATGDYPAWLKEYWALAERLEKEQGAMGERPLRRASECPLPKLSFLVKCLNELRGEATLMGKMRDLARNYPKPEDIPEGEDSDLAHFVGAFLSWLELKEGQDNLGVARSHLFSIMYNIEKGEVYKDDAEAIRQNVLGSFFIDDLAKCIGRS